MPHITNGLILEPDVVPVSPEEGELWVENSHLTVRLGGVDLNLTEAALGLAFSYQAIQVGSSVNTGTSPMTALSLTATGVMAGSYDVSFQYNWSMNFSNKAIIIEAVLDPGPSEIILGTHQQRLFSANLYSANVPAGSKTLTVSLGAGDHTIALRHYREALGAATGTITEARLSIRRIGD